MSKHRSFDTFIRDCRKTYLERMGLTEEQHQNLCRKYREGYDRCVALVRQYAGQRDVCEQELAEKKITETYSTDSTLYRGIHSPGWLQEAVVGRQKKGRPCKKESPQRAFTYVWDEEGRLIAVRRGNEREFITHDGQQSVGVLYFREDVLRVTECVYDRDGCILHRVVVLCDGDENVVEYDEETYAYTAQDTVEVEWARWQIEAEILSVDKYVFKVRDGCLAEYSISVFDTEDITGRPIQERTYAVKKRIRLKR